MKAFSKILISVFVLMLAAVVGFAMVSYGDKLILATVSQTATVAVSQNSAPNVSAYFVSDGQTVNLEDTTQMQNLDPNLQTTSAPVYYVTEYTGVTNENSDTVMTFQPSSLYVKPIGRTVYEDGVRWLSMSGSGVEFDCEGVSADIKLVGENIGSYTVNHRPRAAVYVNGYLVFDRCLESDETYVHIDLTSCGGRAIVKVIKLSESMHSYFGVGAITIRGSRPIVPTEQKKLKIEFIGDSITCGFGVDEPRQEAIFSTATEDFTKCYAYMTACDLDADYSAVAYSGYGIVSGFTSSGVKNNALLPDRYFTAVDGKDSSSQYSEWNFSEFEANLVVINLGTNDASYCSTAQRRAEFVEAYKQFIITVREKNPKAYILCILGDMNNSMYPYIQQAVSEYITQTSDVRVGNTTVSFNMGENDIVISGHPGEKSNRNAADELTQKINELIKVGAVR